MEKEEANAINDDIGVLDTGQTVFMTIMGIIFILAIVGGVYILYNYIGVIH